MADEPAVTMKDLLKFMEKMNQQNQENLKSVLDDNQKNLVAIAAELRKPTELEQKKLDEDALKLKQKQKARLETAKAEEERKERNMVGCTHAAYNPATGQSKHAFRAQVNTPHRQPASFTPVCIICQTVFPKIKATPDQLTQGVNLDLYQGLTAARMIEWAKQSWAEKPQLVSA